MKQGEIWNLSLDPIQGREQAGFRPAVILSGNLMNAYLDVVIVCPLTSKVKGYKGNLVLNPNKVNGLKAKSEVLTFHIRSVSKLRLKERVGVIDSEQLESIKSGLNDLLRY